MTNTIEVNNKTWKTDGQTLEQLRQFRNNEKMLAFVFHAGCAAGRIIEVG